MNDCVTPAYKHTGWRPLLITGLLRQLLINKFSSVSNIEDPSLRDPTSPTIWHENPPTGILIESVYRWRADLDEKRPAVLIKRNAYKNLRVGIADRVGTDGQGNDSYATLWVGSHTLFCICLTGAATEILATEVQRELTQFSPVMVEKLHLDRFQVTDVGEISAVEESSQHFTATITVGWAYGETWSLRPDALPLKAVDINFDFDALVKLV